MKSFDFLFVPRCLACNGYADAYRQLCQNCASILNCIPPYKIKRHLRAVDRLIYLWPYGGPMQKVFSAFKFRGFSVAATTFASIMRDYILYYGIDVSSFILTYIPMHPIRKAFRGYNQSQLLAEELSKLIRIDVLDLLSVKRISIPQHWLKDKVMRRKNVKNLFNAQVTKGKMNVIIIDDVITSGYTVVECAKVLKKNGVEKVWAFGLLG